jgi:hypothetical protein
VCGIMFEMWRRRSHTKMWNFFAICELPWDWNLLICVWLQLVECWK